MRPRGRKKVDRRRAAPAPAPEPEPAPAPDAEPRRVRLNKFLADHGVASRRRCDELIAAGKVTVDGEISTELGVRVDPDLQRVEIDGVVLKSRDARKRTYLLNKPRGVICTNDPRETRPRAVDLVTDPGKGRIYTIGRLDEESEGLILLTSDGELANRVMHPRYGVEKTYLVKVFGEIDDGALQKVREGVRLSEGRTAGARILVLRRGREHSLLNVILREGMNREIRRSFAHVGFKVLALRRVRIGPLTDRGMKVGHWRELEGEEVQALLAGRNESDRAGAADRGSRSKRGPGRRRSGYSRPPRKHPGQRGVRP